ncbi:unnamed protein product [Cyprideis torosa]|uniref:Uncharacterized protein n=1 Tax=Cyprideis torosa TaxID=163714 RepID=A0A7R8ZGH2_9CRUS|nr:unnamed protein product [Cyprideis torosa]CAG0881643.1 unnamed protein product [Cyprideis torosa]
MGIVGPRMVPKSPAAKWSPPSSQWSSVSLNNSMNSSPMGLGLPLLPGRSKTTSRRSSFGQLPGTSNSAPTRSHRENMNRSSTDIEELLNITPTRPNSSLVRYRALPAISKRSGPSRVESPVKTRNNSEESMDTGDSSRLRLPPGVPGDRLLGYEDEEISLASSSPEGDEGTTETPEVVVTLIKLDNAKLQQSFRGGQSFLEVLEWVEQNRTFEEFQTHFPLRDHFEIHLEGLEPIVDVSASLSDYKSEKMLLVLVPKK